MSRAGFEASERLPRERVEEALAVGEGVGLPVVEEVVTVEREVAACDQHPRHPDREGDDRDHGHADEEVPARRGRRDFGGLERRGHCTAPAGSRARHHRQAIAIPTAAATTSGTSAGAR